MTRTRVKSLLKKSSFTLPLPEARRVRKLKKTLGLRSNTAVIRRAITELELRLDRDRLREDFSHSSQLVSRINSVDYEMLDALASENLETD